MPPESLNPTNRHGRTAIIVLLMMLATAGGFAGISLVVDSDTQSVLQMLAIIIGSVGTVWAIVLAVRAAVKGESLVFPFLVLLPIFWALTYPLLTTWPTSNRGVDDKWYFLHFFLFPLTIPLGMLALTLATPAMILFRRRTARAEEADCPRLRKRARLIFLGIAGTVFVLLAPPTFFLYGGTMNRDSKFWTQDVVEEMPLWIGDMDYRVLRSIPNSYSDEFADELLDRGLVSSETLVSEIEGKYGAKIANSAFRTLVRRSPAMALDLSKKNITSPKTALAYQLAAFFAREASQEEVRTYLKPTMFAAITSSSKQGFVDGLEHRRDAKTFVNEMAALTDEKKVGVSAEDVLLAALFIVSRGTDDEVKNVYLKLLERQSVNIESVTENLTFNRHFTMVEEGLRYPEAATREAVMRGIFQIANHRSADRKKAISALREPLARLLDSPHESDRLMSAIVILAAANELTPMTLELYSIKAKGSVVKISYDRANNAQKRALVEHAREALKAW